MSYDFESIIDRSQTGSAKWELMYQQNPNVGATTTPLSVADMEFDNAPEIKEGLKDFIDQSILGYTGASDQFLQAVVDWQKRRHNWTIASEWIVNTPGVVNAIYAAIGALSEEEDGVMLFKPVYYPFTQSIKDLNRTEVNIPLMEGADGYYKIDFETFEKQARKPENKILIFCSPHNPVGRVWKKEELERIAQICVENQVYVVSDEIWNDFVFPGHTHYVLNQLDSRLDDYIITCTSASKSFNIAGLAISNIIIPNEENRIKYKAELSRQRSDMVGILGYQAVQLAYNQAEAWLDELMEVIYENQQFVYHFFKANYPRIKSRMPEGTYLHWLDFREVGMTDEERTLFLQQEAELFTDEGILFGEEGSGFERINVALPKKQLDYQLNLLLKALNERDKKLNE